MKDVCVCEWILNFCLFYILNIYVVVVVVVYRMWRQKRLLVRYQSDKQGEKIQKSLSNMNHRDKQQKKGCASAPYGERGHLFTLIITILSHFLFVYYLH